MNEKDEKKSFGEYIRKKRLSANLTQKELAGRLYVTESTISKWERGLSYPDVSMVTPICAALHITEHEFFTACDDDQAHTQERQAAIWRGVVAGTRRFFAVGYAIAIVTCFICNLAVFHTLSWFWIVLTSVALAFCFTNLPFLFHRNRLITCLGAASGCLILLLLACWINVGGWWIIGGLAITAACLILPWTWWAIWRFYGRHIPPLCMASFSAWIFLLLTVVWVFTGGNWPLALGFPFAAAGLVFLWAGFSVIYWLKSGPWLKSGALILLAAFATPVFNSLCDLLIENQHGIQLMEYFSVREMLAQRALGNPAWVNILIFHLMLVCSLVLIAIGAAAEIRRRKQEYNQRT